MHYASMGSKVYADDIVCRYEAPAEVVSLGVDPERWATRWKSQAVSQTETADASSQEIEAVALRSQSPFVLCRVGRWPS